ncbi:MAG: tetratricopeptide repeat protein [Thiohalocapsa sp.]|uniref:tetratricopeptide repeat protein n=1 Tax=Thiohalocapsa sp. TaxID=2497641 RepID=UPI0025E8298B|nr:tetratricopeptide repeat protein [Thiohalocapsa sp.]MCG6939722.1 tetratricopeptide repeat protein [Thiohalocapsa sp.]
MDRTSQRPTPFVGRAAELATLRQAWQHVEAGKPQFLIWTADTGLGKTRLVQAFYEWLSTHRDARDPDGYWPDSLDIAGRTLAVNPQFPPTDGPRPAIPWLWWGLRFTETRYERGIAASSCGLVNAKEHLAPHLEPLVRAHHGRALTTDAARTTAGILANLFSAGLVSTALDAFSVYELDRERRGLDAPLSGIAEQQSRERRDVVEDLLALFCDLLGSGIAAGSGDEKPRKRPIPCALILDDAHWADVDTLRFVEALYRDALRHHWPLLLLCTHWEQEWNIQHAEARTPNPDNDPRSIADVCERIAARRGGQGAGCCQVERLRRLPDPDLGPVLAAALPGVTESQADALLARVGGNPGFLMDLVAYARTDPMLFEHGDTKAPLTADGFADLRETAELDHQDLIRKRFRELDDALRQTLTLASYQGARFLDDLLLETAARIDGVACTAGDLARGRDPHAIIDHVTTAPLPPASEFRQRAWYEVAHRQLDKPQHRGHKRAFADQLRQVLTDWRTAGRISALEPRDQTLALSLLAAELGRVLDGKAEAPVLAVLGATLADLVQSHQAAGEHRQAASAAHELARRMPKGGWPAAWVELDAQFAAGLGAQGFSAQSDASTLYDSVIAGLEAAGHRAAPPERQNDLATVYSNRGNAHRGRGDLDAAIADYGAAIGLREALRAALGEQWPPAMRNDLAGVYSNRGAAHGNAGRSDDALADFARAVAILQALVDAYPGIPAWRATLEQSEQNLALARRLAVGDADE